MTPTSPSRPGAVNAAPQPTAGEVRALERAGRALRCLPFRRAFYREVEEKAISAKELCVRPDGSALLFTPLEDGRAEAHFRWLIQLGVLRREVDGQGLTERVRLTPMGRTLLRTGSAELPRAGLRERILESLRRHRPRF